MGIFHGIANKVIEHFFPVLWVGPADRCSCQYKDENAGVSGLRILLNDCKRRDTEVIDQLV